MSGRQPVAVDPAGCGCTECLVGLYVPLDQATAEQILALRCGLLANHTGEDVEPLPVTVRDVHHEVCALPAGDLNWRQFVVDVKADDDDLWSVRRWETCYGPDATGHGRVAACRVDHRYPLDVALDVARRAAPRVCVGTLTIYDALSKPWSTPS